MASKKEALAELLPQVPAAWGHPFRHWLRNRTDGQFETSFMTAKRVRYPIQDSPRTPVRYEWAYECHCQHCNAEFITATDGNLLKFWADESGILWAMPPEQQEEPPWFDEDDDNLDTLVYLGNEGEYGFGEQILCPYCEETVELIRPSEVRGGRTIQLLVATVEVVGEYAGVFHWLARKRVDEFGEKVTIHPRHAYIVSPYGGLWKYSHVQGGGFTAERSRDGWKACSDCTDRTDAIYHSWRSANNRRQGGCLYPHIPDLTGTTAEKTGLWMFWKTGEMQVVNYLKIQRAYPFLENLLTAGFSAMVRQLAVKPYLLGMYTQYPMLNVEARKPHEVLCMKKQDFREIKKDADAWDCEIHSLYIQYRREADDVGAVEFQNMLKLFGRSGIQAVRQLSARWPGTSFGKLLRYLDKEHLHYDEVQLLLDARKNAQALAGDRPLTHEELWPRNLIAAHDRLAEEADMLKHPENYTKRADEFRAIKAELQPLEWTDGELCVILPESSGDLIREGRKLRHCVGGYSDSHCSKRQTIFFVRHYRRPERSYYTLSMDLRGVPVQNQLHGYGNERHGPNKEHEHTIPKKVTDFVEAWKTTVLMPWYEQQIQEVSA